MGLCTTSIPPLSSLYRLGGFISYEANAYLQYVICNEVIIPSVTLVSVWVWYIYFGVVWFVCVCVHVNV